MRFHACHFGRLSERGVYRGKNIIFAAAPLVKELLTEMLPLPRFYP